MTLRAPAPTDAFAIVRTIGLTLPDVTCETKYDGSPVLKARGVFVAGLATDESAEADTLVVRCETDDRDLFMEDAPDIYYVTEFYAKYPLVLVRLSKVSDDALRELLVVSRRMALAKARRRL